MSERRDLLDKVNGEVNLFPYVSDTDQYHQDDFWERIGESGKGDCEDFVLEKRARLLDAGVPLEDIRIGVCTVETGGYHAVLVVKDGDGDWVLDQRQPGLATQDELKNLGYTGVEIQTAGKNAWETWKL